MRTRRFGHSRERTDVLRILDPIEQNQPAAFPRGLLCIIEQLVQGKFGKRSHTKRDALVISLGSDAPLENIGLDDLDGDPSRTSELDQFDLVRPLPPRANAQTIQSAPRRQERFANGVDAAPLNQMDGGAPP